MEELKLSAQESLLEPGEETLTQPDASAAETEPRRGPGRLRLLREVVETIALTVVVFVVINALTGRFRVEGPSMRPTLQEGQYLVIRKSVCKLYLPLGGDITIYKFPPPRRGDIIVFHHPQNPDRDLIKRVVGLPYEKVTISKGQVYINGVLLAEPYVKYQAGRSGSYELGADEFFVLGDNRPDSDDSRNWGVVKRDEIIGKAWISYWPPSEWGGVAHYKFSGQITAQEQQTAVEDN